MACGGDGVFSVGDGRGSLVGNDSFAVVARAVDGDCGRSAETRTSALILRLRFSPRPSAWWCWLWSFVPMPGIRINRSRLSRHGVDVDGILLANERLSGFTSRRSRQATSLSLRTINRPRWKA